MSVIDTLLNSKSISLEQAYYLSSKASADLVDLLMTQEMETKKNPTTQNNQKLAIMVNLFKIVDAVIANGNPNRSLDL